MGGVWPIDPKDRAAVGMMAGLATVGQEPAAGDPWQQQWRPIFFEQSPRDVLADASCETDSTARVAARAIQGSRR